MPKQSSVKFTPKQPHPEKLRYQFMSYEIFETKSPCLEVRSPRPSQAQSS
jgi:hypothetical protein